MKRKNQCIHHFRTPKEGGKSADREQSRLEDKLEKLGVSPGVEQNGVDVGDDRRLRSEENKQGGGECTETPRVLDSTAGELRKP